MQSVSACPMNETGAHTQPDKPGRMIVATRLNKDTRRDLIDFFLSEADPTYWREILKQII